MTLRFAPQARRHLDSISEYIRQHNPGAARRVRTEIPQTLKLLDQFPHMGHAGAAKGTHEVVVPHRSYVIVHRIEPNGDVVVVGIYHSAQLRPGQPES
jgi:plasmid stabilization system protein ParE